MAREYWGGLIDADGNGSTGPLFPYGVRSPYAFEARCRFDLAAILAGPPTPYRGSVKMMLCTTLFGLPKTSKDKYPCARSYVLDLKNHLHNLQIRVQGVMAQLRIQAPVIELPDIDIPNFYIDSTTCGDGSYNYNEVDSWAKEFVIIKRALLPPLKSLEGVVQRSLGSVAESKVLEVLELTLSPYPHQVEFIQEFVYANLSLIFVVASGIRSIHMDLDVIDKQRHKIGGGGGKMLRVPSPYVVE